MYSTVFQFQEIMHNNKTGIFDKDLHVSLVFLSIFTVDYITWGEESLPKTLK